MNLQGVTVSCWVYLPPGSAGDPNAPNGVQLFFKSDGWYSWYSQWQNIQSEWEGNWVKTTVNLSDPPDFEDPDFDATKVIAVGLKVAINDSSAATLQGTVYLDDYVLNTAPPIIFDFEQLEVKRDFITIQQALDKCSTRVVRVFIFADGRASPDFDSTGQVTGFDKYFFQDFDALLEIAEQENILLIPVLLDYLWFTRPAIVNGVQLGGHSDIVRDSTKLQTFLNKALIPLVETYFDNPHILAWDIINEPEWAMQNVLPSKVGPDVAIDPVTIEEMQEFVRLCAETIHTRTSHQVTVGSASISWLHYWQRLGLDLYQFHWYDHLGDPFPWPNYAELRLDKPCFIGEVPTANTQHSTKRFLITAYTRAYHGVLVWSYRASDAFSDFCQAAPRLEKLCALPFI